MFADKPSPVSGLLELLRTAHQVAAQGTPFDPETHAKAARLLEFCLVQARHMELLLDPPKPQPRSGNIISFVDARARQASKKNPEGSL